LSEFNCSLLDFIQAATSLMHPEICDDSIFTAAGKHEPYICVSSAYRCGVRPWFSINEMRSAVHKTNKTGPILCVLYGLNVMRSGGFKVGDGVWSRLREAVCLKTRGRVFI